jgi:hypothetical protein
MISGFTPTLPGKLALQRSEGMLQGLADEPSLLVGNGVGERL